MDGEWKIAIDPLREREAIELFVQHTLAVSSNFAANDKVGEDLPAPRLPAARDRARRCTYEGSLAVGSARTTRAAAACARGRLYDRRLERQRTLRATIAWSHDLLKTAAEQDLFARLAVFAAGCTLEATEEICGADVDAIASLVNKSLLRHTGDRYWMLETISRIRVRTARPAARGRRCASGSPCGLLRRTRRNYTRARSCARGEPISGSTGSTPSTRTCGRRWELLLESGDADGALRLSESSLAVLADSQYWTEGRRFLADAVALGADLEGRSGSSTWLFGSGAPSALWQGDLDEGEQLVVPRILEEFEDSVGPGACVLGCDPSVFARRVVTRSSRPGSDVAQGIVHIHAVRRGDQWLQSIALNNLGTVFRG